MTKWFLIDTKHPDEGQQVIIITHNDDVSMSDGVLQWVGIYRNMEFIVTSFCDEGCYKLNLPVVCWTPLPKIPFFNLED